MSQEQRGKRKRQEAESEEESVVEETGVCLCDMFAARTEIDPIPE
jgi:hypothetical protein